MKKTFRNHLLPLLGVFIIISGIWLLFKIQPIEILYLFIGLLLGSFLLDTDHFIFWFYIKPNIEESRLAQIAFKNRDLPSVLALLKLTHKTHNNLIFHHYFFQIILALISFFVFTSSHSTLFMALLLSANLHLLVDGVSDYLENPKLFQHWLFARESQQLPIKQLKYYLGSFTAIIIIFVFLLIRSKL